eukprot:3239991-Amphidinium_carterae.3
MSSHRIGKVNVLPLAPTCCLANAVSSSIVPVCISMERQIIVMMQELVQIISIIVTLPLYSRSGAKPTHMSLTKLTGGMTRTIPILT